MSAVRTLFLRIATVLLAGLGVWSFSVLGVWTRLNFTYSLDVWNFKTSVTPFFGHWAAVVTLPAIGTHYAMARWKNRQHTRPASSSRGKSPGGEVAQMP